MTIDKPLEYKNRDNLRSLFIGIAIFGILITIIGILLSIKFIFLDVKNKGKTNAYVTIQNKHTIKVTYNIDNKKYKRSFFVFNKHYINGESVKIYYDKRNPNNALLSSNRFYSLFIPIAGILVQGISGIGLIYVYAKYYNKYRPVM